MIQISIFLNERESGVEKLIKLRMPLHFPYVFKMFLDRYFSMQKKNMETFSADLID
jgi:hypothetical protein